MHQQVENNLENSTGSVSAVQVKHYGELIKYVTIIWYTNSCASLQV